MTLKAFDLLPVIEKITVGQDRSPSHTLIESLECCAKDLFIGTSDSYVIHYMLEEKHIEDTDCVLLSTQKKKSISITNLKKPVVQIKAISALDRILCLCDNILVILNMSSLQVISSLSKLKGVTYFCINENPLDSNPFQVQICIARRKILQLFTLTDDRLLTCKEFSVPESPITMAMDGQFICFAMSSKYAFIDCDSGAMQELCNYDGSCLPQVERITKQEFLLNGPGSLGIFVTCPGISERLPLQWSENVVSVAYSHPYIITVRTNSLVIYSILDQQEKQRIAFYGGIKLGNFDGRLFVASTDIVCSLVPVPWQRQVEGLLADKKVEDALELAHYANKSSIPEDKIRKIMQNIQQKCGFIKFSLFQFEEARELFLQSQLNVVTLISLFPRLLSSHSKHTPCDPPLHDIPSAELLCAGDAEMLQSCTMFLQSYLEDVRNTTNCTDYLELDTALLKLYSESNNEILFEFVIKASCDAKETEEILLQNHRYHALALYCDKCGKPVKALQIWNKILSGSLKDPAFPGILFLITFLSTLQDVSLVWKYAEVVLDQNEELGIRIFTERLENSIKPDDVVQFLQRYSVATIKFLENLVFEKKIEKERFHTHLALLYMDLVVRLQKEIPANEEKLKGNKEALRHLLRFSSSYRVQLVLGKALENQLHYECAILYGKLEDHDKALRILVHTLSDYNAAEEYCIRLASDSNLKQRQHIFHTLLGVYLDPKLDVLTQEQLLTPAIKLLNSEMVDFDAVKVLKLLPVEWSVAVVENFLSRALRGMKHQCRSVQVQKALTRQQTIQMQFARFHYSSGNVQLSEERLCTVCKKPFVEAAFAWYPNSVITHQECAKHLTCPVSGRTFSCPKDDTKR